LTLAAFILLYALELPHCQVAISCVDDLNAIALVLESALRSECPPYAIFVFCFIQGRTGL
jgi:hypothetical protein